MQGRLSIVFFGLMIAVLCGGCASTLHIERNAPTAPFDGGSQLVYVSNPELVREISILRDSGIYRLTDSPDGARRLTLEPLVQYGRCGNPLMLTIFTFGLVPGYLPGAYVFEYELETDRGVQRFGHRLPVYERFSIWERLSRQDSDSVLSKALRISERIQRQPNQALQTTPVTRSEI